MSAQQRKTIKRGARFALDVEATAISGSPAVEAPINLTGFDVTCEVRSRQEVAGAYTYTLIGALTVSILDAAAGLLRLTAGASATDAWPVGELYADVVLTETADPENVIILPTFSIQVDERVTRHG